MGEALLQWEFGETGFNLDSSDDSANLLQEPPRSDTFAYNNHSESIFDDYRYFPGLKKDHESVVKFDENNEDFINHATLKALIVQLTSPEVIDYNLICDFFLTFRTFTDSHTVLNLLLTRLIWALQYINTQAEETQHIGQLVLLRTFVVLRHWILNYFLDDFDFDPKLGDTFVYFMNSITNESNLVREDMVFERKIITDLKTHWISKISEFYSTTLSHEHVFSLTLPMLSESVNFRKLTKSSTQTSLRTNPSFRRSAMLSLYDQRAHYKCLIHDESNVNDENPQLSITNLLAQHKSSRTSLNDKLSEFQGRNCRKSGRKPLAASKQQNTAKHNYKNLKDSSLALKKTTDHPEQQENKSAFSSSGFSTNGHVKLPSSKVTTILPPTPVKKMDVTLKNYANRSNSKNKSHTCLDTSTQNDIDRKLLSRRLLMDGKSPSTIIDMKALFKVQKSQHDARIVDELEYLINYYITDQSNAITEAEDMDDISRSEIDFHSPKRDSFVEVNIEEDDRTSKSRSPGKPEVQADITNDNISMRDLPDLSIDRIDNFFKSSISAGDKSADQRSRRSKVNSFYNGQNDSGTSSFGRVASLNWNDEGNLNLEHSEQLDESLTNDEEFKEDALRAEKMIRSGTQYFDVPSDLESNGKSRSSISTPSDIGNYNEEVVDLNIAMSPQSMKRTVTMQQINRQSSSSFSGNKRLSMISRNSSGSVFKRDSIKSYLSYDSAFSVSRNEMKIAEAGALRKKHAIQDLRKIAQQEGHDKEFMGPIENESGATSHLKLARGSSCLSSGSSIRKSLCLWVLLDGQSQSGKSSNIDDSSVFSVAGRDKTTTETKVAHKSTSDNSSSNSVAIPGISSYVLKELAAIPDESFSSTNNPIQSALSRLEGKVKLVKSKSGFTIARRSAAGDDGEGNTSVNDKISRDDKFKSSIEDSFDDDDERSEEFHNNTEDILAEINNAATEDAIDYSSDVEKELTDKPLTPIKTRVRSTLNGTSSTPNMNALLTNAPNSENTSPFSILTPKALLDQYSLRSQNLTIENVMKSSSHISFVLSYDSKSLAEHFTMIEKDMLQDIDWKELIELNWNKELTPVNSWLEIIVNESYYTQNKGVNLVIARFNLMVNWIISEILLTTEESERIAIMSRFIHVAHHSQILQNFSTLMQIILALTSEKISKLRETWKKLPPGDLLTLKNLEELTSPFKNFINIRLCTNQVRPSLGCIPFVGLYLSDLIFNAERPKFVKRQSSKPLSPPIKMEEGEQGSQRTPTIGDSTSSSDIETDQERLINFSRFRTSVHIVKSLSQSIEWSRNYDFPVNDELLRKCLYIKSLDEDEMNFCLKVHNDMTVGI
ncbi:hypothetical protein CJJ09_002029 [Candidozyma auris]|nr:hypothetical protein CJJ09_002029 [[Candida] auris]